MEKVTELIARLCAIESFCKDIHYTNVSYQDHLLADRIHDGISTHVDDIKEQVILSGDKLPLSSKEYLKKTIEFIPNINAQENKVNWINLKNLIKETKALIDGFEAKDRGVNALLDNIAQDLSTDIALLFIQTRREDTVSEAIDKDHAAATETPIDRKEFKAEELKPSPDQALALKYDAENVLVAEDILDRLTQELGIDVNEN